ncbi:hypothetical protein C8R48DRAFT_674287 [Suillus tomentosus]|nr:hypothetical protein C8R48DRAFT_674287 [Suillus tomentosus]
MDLNKRADISTWYWPSYSFDFKYHQLKHQTGTSHPAPPTLNTISLSTGAGAGHHALLTLNTINSSTKAGTSYPTPPTLNTINSSIMSQTGPQTGCNNWFKNWLEHTQHMNTKHPVFQQQSQPTRSPRLHSPSSRLPDTMDFSGGTTDFGDTGTMQSSNDEDPLQSIVKFLGTSD